MATYQGLDPIITAARLGWDKGDPWGSGMHLLGAVCDFYTAVGFGSAGHVWTDGTPSIPEEIGYRPAATLQVAEFESLVHREEVDGADGTEWEWDDPAMWDVAYALGFELVTDDIDAPDVIASDADWMAAPEQMQRTMRVLHRYLNLVKAAGLDY